MSKLTAAYIAGFVDGEGHISIYPFVRKDRDNQVYYKAQFKVTNTNKEIIEWLKASFGGWIYTQNMSNPLHKIAYTWSLDSKNLKLVLQSIYPYLKIKKKQAELVLEKLKLAEKFSGMVYEKEQVEQIRNIYLKLRILNKRGTSLHAERLTEITSKEEVIV